MVVSIISATYREIAKLNNGTSLKSIVASTVCVSIQLIVEGGKQVRYT